MKPYKILITGSFCSGKSTLVNALASQLENVYVIPEVTREILALYGKVDWSRPELRDYILIKQLIEEEKAMKSNAKYIIVDSGIVSFLAHDKVLLPGDNHRQEVLTYFRHNPYDLIFVCDHNEVDIDDDGQRYIDDNLRNNIYKVMLDVLLKEECLYCIIKGNVRNRIKQILNMLEINNKILQ
ncbi:MAG: ATP-binding protein [Prevotella sp.]|nr:ATP-binding protein [Prevotella sp.]